MPIAEGLIKMSHAEAKAEKQVQKARKGRDTNQTEQQATTSGEKGGGKRTHQAMTHKDAKTSAAANRGKRGREARRKTTEASRAEH